MMDRGRARNVNEAARRFAEILADSYRVVYGQAAESTERQQRLAREFSELVANNLREHTEGNRSTAQQLSEQANKQREAGREFARESINAHMDFLNTAFSQYREGAQRAAGSAQERARVGSQTVTYVVGIAAETTRDTADITADATRTAAESAAGQPPIADYEEMNVEEITEQLDGLSEAELVRVRNYEQRNKNRGTLLAQIDRRLEATL
ncbi:MAG: hypothetical protein WKF95_13825 [Rubrobacter sp.]